MCRGCCCGTTRKHPDVDHDAVAAALAGAAGPDAPVLRVDCLWACDLSNVVVVNPAVEARRRGVRPAWVPYVDTAERARAVGDWVRRGGPGCAEPPPGLDVRTAAGLRRTATTR